MLYADIRHEKRNSIRMYVVYSSFDFYRYML